MDNFGLLLALCTITVLHEAETSPVNTPPVDWNHQAQETLSAALANEHNTRKAKNVILFLGDGMSISSAMAARTLKGQQMGNPGEETYLQFEQFPNVALSKTYNTDLQVGDSAGTATAFLCGVKARGGTAGVNQHVKKGRCDQVNGNQVTSIAKWFQDAGRSSGVVSTARITHATPSAAYCHTANRDWESDFGENQVDAERQGCKDIATQLVEGDTGKKLKVILGGGRKHFLAINDTDPEYPDVYGVRGDGRNLIQTWLDQKEQGGHRADYVWNKAQFEAVNLDSTDYLLGLFESDHMQYELDRDTDAEPSLAELTATAVNMLKKDEGGFFLLVEGGRIDHAHHQSLAHKALAEVLAMDLAVEKAMELTNPDETLIVVTADHSHVFTVAGYPERGNDILGLTGQNGLDGLPYTTLSYANGPGGLMPEENRANLSGVNTGDKDFVTPSLVPLRHETHSGEDVAIYAQGPMAHLFHGVHEQNYIAHVMAYAACVGENKKHCDKPKDTQKIPNSGVDKKQGSYQILFLMTLVASKLIL